MNVSCPQCATVFRVDPAKVPERGVRARCSECGGLIAVRRPHVGTPAVPPMAESPMPVIAPVPLTPAYRETAAPPPQSPETEVRHAAEPPPVPVAVEPPQSPAVDAWPSMDTPSVPAAVAPPAPPAQPEPEPIPAPRMPASVPFAALPVDAPAPRPPAGPPHAAAPGRFTNPFLQQDPSVRARRLARALVSDLVVYHPDKRQRGLADGTLKELFAEEIRKSWEEYSEQIGEDVARSTPYFTEALNEILAEGRPLFE
jgi:predicted Zn finger-like uncharacterized protein